jgi:hypothetical protein
LILFALYEREGIIKIALINLFLFFTVFTVGSDFINQNKTERFLKNISLNENKSKIVSFRSDITGTAFYLKPYKKIDSAVQLPVKEKFYLISRKSDYNNYLNESNNCYKIIAETKSKIFVRYNCAEIRNKQ